MKMHFLTSITVIYFLCSSVQAADINLSELSLSHAKELLKNNNHELLAAKRMVESAESGVTVAGQKPNPVLTVGLSNLNINRDQGNTNPDGSNSLGDKTINSSIQINQLFERGNKRELRMQSAKNATKASEYDFKNASFFTVRQKNDF